MTAPSGDIQAKNQHANNGKQSNVDARVKRTLTLRVMTTVCETLWLSSRHTTECLKNWNIILSVCLRFHDKLREFKSTQMAINLIKCCHRWRWLRVAVQNRL